MPRRYLVVILVAGVLLPNAVSAQERTVITGVVPAPPGTTVRLEVFDATTLAEDGFKIKECAKGVTTRDSSSPGLSHFSFEPNLPSCTMGFIGTYFYYRVCWGENLCDLIWNLQAGATRDVGRLTTERYESEPIAEGPAEVIDAGDGVRDAALPATGSGDASGGTDWLLWTAVSLAALGLGVGSVSLARRWRA